MRLTAGTRLSDRYQVISQLGAGGMGEVYRAKDTRLDREVAIKVLPEHLSGNPQSLSRFEREAKALAALNDPRIVAIHDFGAHEGTSFAVMELLKGETLRSVISRSSIAVKNALQIGIAVAEGLHAAHSTGIIHRDLKPENIFITNDGAIKILDLGLAQWNPVPAAGPQTETPTLTNQTAPGAVMGTLPYMSPEQLRGEKIDVRTDIFSFGAVLYEMITGKSAFMRRTSADTISAILNDPLPPISESGKDITPGIEPLISHCLEKSPAARFQSAGDLAYALRNLDSGSNVQTVAVRPSSRMKPAAWLLLIVITALAIAGSVFLLAQKKKEARSLAILPFVNTQNDPESEYLSDGVTQSIINKMSQLPQIHVLAHDTVFSYKGRRVDPRKVGRELNVDAIVTGQLVQQGNVLEIRVNLINVEDGAQLWGDQYRKDLQDIFAIQDEIALSVTENLQLKLTGKEKELLAKHYTENTEAYQLFLKGYHYQMKEFSEEDYLKSVEFYELAIQKDPNYALAYSLLSTLYASIAFQGLMPVDEAREKTEKNIRKALEIDNSLPDVHFGLAVLSWTFEWNWKSFESEIRKVIATNPNHADSYYLLGQNLRALGRFEEAIANCKKAVELDPRSPDKIRSLGATYFWAGQYDPAIEQFRKVLQMDPHYVQAHDYLSDVYARKGMYQEAVSEEMKYLKLVQDEEGAEMLRQDFHAQGYLKAKQLQYQRILEMYKNAEEEEQYIPPLLYAAIHTRLENKDEAFSWLEKAYEERAPWLTYIKTDPQFENLHSDPRFAELLKKIGLPL